MTRWATLLLLLAAGCSGARGDEAAPDRPLAPGAFRVAVLGDMPYPAPGERALPAALAGYRALLDTIAAEPVAFVVHVGDITGRICSDSLYAERRREFDALPHPLVYTFGDNEWTDCGRDRSERRGGRDPLERLARLRAVFTAGDSSLGARRIALERQSADPQFATFRENVRWREGEVRFVAVHVVGSNNNRGRRDRPRPEHAARTAANVAWLRETFALATREGARGVAVFMQANPLVGRRRGGFRDDDGFADVVVELERLAAAFGRPVAVVHGDTHSYRVDRPFVHPESGAPLPHVIRAETFGSPRTHGMLMTVDPGAPELFRFDPLLVAGGARR